MREKKQTNGNEINKVEAEKENVEIKEEQLDKIAKEIDNNKSKSILKKEKKYKDIIRNILIAILITAYFALLLFGNGRISTIEYITTLKAVIIFDLIVTIILFEAAFKKDNFNIGMHGIEMAFVGGLTVYILDLVSKENTNINIFFSAFIGIVAVYYIIKSIVLAIKKRK